MSALCLVGIVLAQDAGDDAVRCGRVAALVQPAGQDLPPNHRHRLVVQAAAKGPVAPAKRSVAFESAAALSDWLARCELELSCLLERLAGCVELLLTREARFGRAPTPATGAGYLRVQGARLQAIEAERQELLREAEQMQQALRLECPAVRATPWEARDALGCDVSVLAPCRELARLECRLRALAPSSWRLTGPWPPYSFAELPT